jgi:hypothetical protein
LPRTGKRKERGMARGRESSGWIALSAATLVTVIGLAGQQRPPSQDLSGSWAITTFGVTWKVGLERREANVPSELPLFCGQATGTDNKGKPVTNQLCAVHFVDRGVLRVSVRTKVAFICESPFKPNGTMQGRCAVADGSGESGPFKASRVPAPKE